MAFAPHPTLLTGWVPPSRMRQRMLIGDVTQLNLSKTVYFQ